MGYSLHANEVPFSTFRVSAAYLTSELAGRCGPMHIKQARGAEMICSGQSVCLPGWSARAGSIPSRTRCGSCRPMAACSAASRCWWSTGPGQGGTLHRHKIVTRADSEVPIGR